MALINPASITDIQARRLVDNAPDTLANIQQQVDDDVYSEALDAGITTDRVPIDENGFTTSVVLRRYGRYRFLMYVMEALQGGVENGDAYGVKADRYEKRSFKAARKITAETILNNEENRAASRQSSAPAW